MDLDHTSPGIASEDHRTRLRARASKDSNAVDLTLILDREQSVFTARCYASAVYAVVVCPSVCLSVRPTLAGILSKQLDI